MPRKTPPKSAAAAPDARSLAGLRHLQQWMAAEVMEPLAADGGRRRRVDGAARVIKPNNRLSSFERLEIYNVQYWLRLLASLREDFPALEAALGEAAFDRMARTYLARHPSRSFTLRDLGARLPGFLARPPGAAWAGRGNRARFAREVARFEWAQVVAFDAEALPPPTPAQLAAVPPARLRLRLQPHLTLLKFAYPIDAFVAGLQRHAEAGEDERLRAAASQAMEPEAAAPRRARRPAPIPAPRATYLAVHRADHLLYVKRLEPAAFRLLSALERGLPLARACALAFPTPPRGVTGAARRAALFQDWFQLWAELGWLTLPDAGKKKAVPPRGRPAVNQTQRTLTGPGAAADSARGASRRASPAGRR